MLARRIVLAVVLVFALVLGGSAQATSPGVNGRIVFTASRDQNSELYSVNADGTAERRLTWTADYEDAPAWSPDGTQIAYQRLVPLTGAGSRIWVMNADGSGAHEVSPPADPSVYDTQPAWSPDGTQLAFGSSRAGANLWVMNADGTGARAVTSGFGIEPSWSPDGRRIAYTSLHGIGIVKVDGTNEHDLAGPGFPASRPSWSPDGSALVFQRNNAQGYAGELSIVNADGTGEHQLTSDGSHHGNPSWSPDGSEIVFSRALSQGGANLWAIRPDGNGLRQITADFLSGGNPDWGTSQLVPTPTMPESPSVFVFTPIDGATYASSMQMRVYFVCFSPVTNILSCSGSQRNGDLLDVSTPGTHTLTILAVDMEDRIATKTVTYSVRDDVAPDVQLLTPTDNATYEQGAPLNVHYSCSDAGGLATCNGDTYDGAPLDTSHPGTHTFSVRASDTSGNTRTVTATYTIVAVAPPTITIDSPAEGTNINLGLAIPAAFTCATGSPEPLTLCTGTLANGDLLDTASVGPKLITVRAADSAGRTTVINRGYNVVYAWGGFATPVDGNNTIKLAQAGQPLPLRFSLAGDHGLGVVVRVTSQLASCADWSTSGPADPVQGTLSYNSSTGRYLDSAATSRAQRRTCTVIDLVLDDGTEHRVRVEFG